jgi:NhaA family Na+:H+ antiporter
MKKIQDFFKNFLERDSSTGILLIVATIAALIVANTPLNNFYNVVMELEFTLGFPDLNITKSIHHWVNDGLMSLFFLLVGLEIKGELKFGRLKSFKSAVFPVVAAVCGAIIPALIYWGFNYDTIYLQGWAIPMATDIAFVIGILALLGSRVHSWVKVFVTTIAVVDDLIAVLVIAFFYTENISWSALGIAGICVLILLFFNLRNTARLSPYLIVGFVLWWAVLASGIHATIAGVVLAFTIPLHRVWGLDKIKAFAKKGFDQFKRAKDETLSYGINQAYYYLEKTQREMESPLRRLERKLHKPVYLLIMPLFAFVNAGIVIDGEIMTNAFKMPVTWGIIAGLFVGKQVGILLGIWVLLKLFYKNMPNTKAIWKVLHGVSLLCGIGFTMSLFIANLSFSKEIILEEAKIGILVSSILSGVLGYYILYKGTANQEGIQSENLSIANTPSQNDVL